MTTWATLRCLSAVLLGSLIAVGIAPAAEKGFAAQRAAMVRTIEDIVASTASALGRDTLSPSVLAALEHVPRHRFVPEGRRDAAYANGPLPIGYGQTISQPYIVAIMSDLIDVEPGDRVLEIGTGSGYQAAILAELVEEVHTMEIIEPLGRRAMETLADRNNVTVHLGDGYHGLPDAAPFDAIVVTAAASHVPPPLVRQLAPGARMIIPVGSRFTTQQLLLIEKLDAHASSIDNSDGASAGVAAAVRTRQILPVRFVPLTGEH